MDHTGAVGFYSFQALSVKSISVLKCLVNPNERIVLHQSDDVEIAHLIELLRKEVPFQYAAPVS